MLCHPIHVELASHPHHAEVADRPIHAEALDLHVVGSRLHQADQAFRVCGVLVDIQALLERLACARRNALLLQQHLPALHVLARQAPLVHLGQLALLGNLARQVQQVRLAPMENLAPTAYLDQTDLPDQMVNQDHRVLLGWMVCPVHLALLVPLGHLALLATLVLLATR